jgi:hypothetical protein
LALFAAAKVFGLENPLIVHEIEVFTTAASTAEETEIVRSVKGATQMADITVL